MCMKALAGLFGGGGGTKAPVASQAAQAISPVAGSTSASVAAPAAGDAAAGRVTLGVASDDARRKRAGVPGLGL